MKDVHHSAMLATYYRQVRNSNSQPIPGQRHHQI